MNVSQKWTDKHEAIHAALNSLMKACGLDNSESATEVLFGILEDAVLNVADQWDEVVEQSHRDGLCYDVNALLAQAIDRASRGWHFDRESQGWRRTTEQ
jgi:hypothetical protein